MQVSRVSGMARPRVAESSSPCAGHPPGARSTRFVAPPTRRTTVTLRGEQGSPGYHCAAEHCRADRCRRTRACGPRCRNGHRVGRRFQAVTVSDRVDHQRWFKELGKCVDDHLPPNNDDEGGLRARRSVLRAWIDNECASHEAHGRMRHRSHHRHGHHVVSLGGGYRWTRHGHLERQLAECPCDRGRLPCREGRLSGRIDNSLCGRVDQSDRSDHSDDRPDGDSDNHSDNDDDDRWPFAGRGHTTGLGVGWELTAPLFRRRLALLTRSP